MKKIWTYFALATMMVSLTSSADHEGSAASVVFDGSDLHPVVSLSNKESHTIYETHEVPSTCYKDEIVGTEPVCNTVYHDECHTEYQNECHTEYSNECHNDWQNECNTVYHDECHTSYENECHTTYQQECHTVNHQDCHTTYQQECHTQNVCQRVPTQECTTRPDGQQVCRTVYKDECHSQQQCQQVPRQECTNHPQQECQQVPHQQCQQVPRQQCERVPTQECHQVQRPVCQQVPHQSCQQVPHQSCQQIPSQECHDVPKHEQVPYECTKTETVAVGEEVDFVVNGDAHFDFGSIPSGIQPNEKLKVLLEDEEMRLSQDQLSGKLLLIVKRDQAVKTVKEDQGANSPGEKQVTANFEVTLTDPAVLSNGIGGGIRNLELAAKANTLALELGKGTVKDLLGLDLRLVRKDANNLVFDGKLPREALTLADTGSGTRVLVDLSKLQLREQISKGKKYLVSLKAYLDPKPELGTPLNPEIGGSGSEIKDQSVKADK